LSTVLIKVKHRIPPFARGYPADAMSPCLYSFFAMLILLG
jgi:hypothetical protein